MKVSQNIANRDRERDQKTNGVSGNMSVRQLLLTPPINFFIHLINIRKIPKYSSPPLHLTPDFIITATVGDATATRQILQKKKKENAKKIHSKRGFSEKYFICFGKSFRESFHVGVLQLFQKNMFLNVFHMFRNFFPKISS